MADRCIKEEIELKRMVEWKKLGEACKLERGVRVVKKDLHKEGQIPVYQNSLTPLGYFERSNYPEKTPFVICAGAAGDIGFSKESFWAADDCTCIVCSPLVNSKFVFYFLMVKQPTLKSQVRKASVPRLSKDVIGKLDIPIPPLSEQNRIVGILDTFTSSIENLKQQIVERRKQYEHYRDQLLDLEGKEGVERIILKDVCEVINGRAYSQPELLGEGKYRVLRVGNFFSNDSWYYSDLELDDKYYCNNGDLLYAWSASFGPHIWEEEKVIYHYHIWKMNCGEKINKKFMYYWLQSEDMRRQAFTNLHGATMAHLTKALMESLMVPTLSPSEQSRIVSILDTFEASISNLEAQLKEREKQYEYYRNKLLTFE